MGMAASQARLLTITARQHDVEYKAQSIQNAKIQLATQQDEAYKDYLEALDATTLTVKDWEGNRIPATFNNLCGFNGVDIATGNQYIFHDSKGKLIVPEDIKTKYDSFRNYSVGTGTTAPYVFAYYALGVDITDEGFLDNIGNAESEIATKYSAPNQEAIDEVLQSIVSLMQGKLTMSAEEGGNNYKDLGYITSLYNQSKDKFIDGLLSELCYVYDENGKPIEGQYQDRLNVKDIAEGLLKAKEKLEQLTRPNLYGIYRTHAEEVFTKAGYAEKFNQDKFDYYVQWFKNIEASGGECISIDDYDGTIAGYEDEKPHAGDDSECLQNMIQCGKITISLVKTDKKTGAVTLPSTGVPSDSILEYTTTTTIDKSAMAKAEAEYEHKNKQINQKDKQYDMDLAKLDTERSALKKEYDSITKVIDDNIERTFGIFS